MAFLFNFVGNLTNSFKVMHAQATALSPLYWEEIPGSEYVVKLNGENVGFFIRSNSSVLLFFHSPNCGHCQALMPEFAKAAMELNKQDTKVKMAALDVLLYKNAQKQFKLTAVPTINLYKGGKFMMEYKNSRVATQITGFARRHAN